VTGVVTGHQKPEEVLENMALIGRDIPAAFWDELKAERILPEAAPTL
jgi:hypothetical protein